MVFGVIESPKIIDKFFVKDRIGIKCYVTQIVAVTQIVDLQDNLRTMPLSLAKAAAES